MGRIIKIVVTEEIEVMRGVTATRTKEVELENPLTSTKEAIFSFLEEIQKEDEQKKREREPERKKKKWDWWEPDMCEAFSHPGYLTKEDFKPRELTPEEQKWEEYRRKYILKEKPADNEEK